MRKKKTSIIEANPDYHACIFFCWHIQSLLLSLQSANCKSLTLFSSPWPIIIIVKMDLSQNWEEGENFEIKARPDRQACRTPKVNKYFGVDVFKQCSLFRVWACDFPNLYSECVMLERDTNIVYLW